MPLPDAAKPRSAAVSPRNGQSFADLDVRLVQQELVRLRVRIN